MKIKINFGAFLLLFSIILSNNIVYSIIYIFCAMMHELGHLIAARLMNVKIAEMSFDIAGAKIIPAGQISSYRREFILCAAGPSASFLLSAISAIILKNKGAELNISYLNTVINEDILSLDGVLAFVFIFSILQAVINLIPIASFDGGRMMNASIAYLFGEEAAQTSAKAITFIFALVLWMMSVYLLIKAGRGLSLFSFSLCMFIKIFDGT